MTFLTQDKKSTNYSREAIITDKYNHHMQWHTYKLLDIDGYTLSALFVDLKDMELDIHIPNQALITYPL